MKTKTETTTTAGDAVVELRRLDELIRHESKIRDQRERELTAALGKGGAAGAIEDLSAMTDQVVALQTALSLADRALSGARKRARQLMIIVAGEAGRLSNELEAVQRDLMAAALARAEKQVGNLRDIFPDADAKALLGRTKIVREVFGFVNLHSSSTGLDFVFIAGQPTLSPEVPPGAVLQAHARLTTALAEAKAKLTELRRGGAS